MRRHGTLGFLLVVFVAAFAVNFWTDLPLWIVLVTAVLLGAWWARVVTRR